MHLTTTSRLPRLGGAERTALFEQFATDLEWITLRRHIKLDQPHVIALVRTMNARARAQSVRSNHKRSLGASSESGSPKKRSRSSLVATSSMRPSDAADALAFESPAVTSTIASEVDASQGADSDEEYNWILRELGDARQEAVGAIADDERPYLSHIPSAEPFSANPTREDPDSCEGWQKRSRTFFERVTVSSWNQVGDLP